MLNVSGCSEIKLHGKEPDVKSSGNWNWNGFWEKIKKKDLQSLVK